MFFNFHLPTVSYILFGAALLCIACIAIVYCRRLSAISRAKKTAAGAEPSADMPFASIIVYARNESDTLHKNLGAILSQDYPAGYEVIVVNDGSSPETNMVVSGLKVSHPNLYLTFTPNGARNLSRKKLGLTLGIKAAKGQVVIITDANTTPLSDRWLASMMQPFADHSVEVVLGLGRYTRPDRLAGHYTRIFDQAADSATWLAAALTGHPYRGCGFNLAYRRQLFFDNKGFSSSLNLRNGDDDIFVNEITNGANTAVQLADEALAEKNLYPFAKASRGIRVSHAFTGRHLPRASRRIMASGEWAMWIAILCAAAGVVTGDCLNAWPWILAAVLVLAMWTMVAASWHSVLHACQMPHLVAHLPLAAMTRPWRNAMANLRSHSAAAAHYTWQ